MAGEIRFRGRATQTGLSSVTATVYDDTGAVTGSSIAMTEIGSATALYTGDMPGSTAVGRYSVRIFDSGGAELGKGNLFWDGKQEVDVAYLRKLQANILLTNPADGLMTVFDDDDSTVLVQTTIYEDVSQAQAYQGQGIERRNRLS